MAATMVLGHPPLLSDEDDLSDTQIHSLLLEAEVRLREREESHRSALITDRAADFKLPNLSPGEIAQTRIFTDGGIARVDPSAVVNSGERELANKDRKVEDPVVVKKKQAEVRLPYTYEAQYSHSANDENIPNISL